jgi:hypothetical protein
VPSYLVEIYVSRDSTRERAALESRARSAAEDLTREHTSVSFERSIYVPEDEICFVVFQAGSSREAALAAERADLGAIRVVEAIASGEERK